MGLGFWSEEGTQGQMHTGGHPPGMEAETGRMGLQAKDTKCGRQSEAGGGGKEPSREGLWPPEL